MTVVLIDQHQDLRDAVRQLCARYPGEYWRDLDSRQAYPDEFVATLTQAGWLSALIPTQYGGSGLGISEASVILEEVNRSGGNSAVPDHALDSGLNKRARRLRGKRFLHAARCTRSPSSSDAQKS